MTNGPNSVKTDPAFKAQYFLPYARLVNTQTQTVQVNFKQSCFHLVLADCKATIVSAGCLMSSVERGRVPLQKGPDIKFESAI